MTTQEPDPDEVALLAEVEEILTTEVMKDPEFWWAKGWLPEPREGPD